MRQRTDNSTKVPRFIGITGATGFMGKYISRHLLATGRYQIRALSRFAAAPERRSEAIEWRRGDLNAPRDCEAFVRGLGAVIHLAHTNTPLSSHRDWAGDAVLNIVPTLNLIEALRREGRRVDLVFASSGGAMYEPRAERSRFKETDAAHPNSPYGVAKLAIENYLRLAADQGWLRVTVLRIGNAYGTPLPPQRRQGLIGIAIHHVLRGEPVPVYGDLRNVRDWVHLADVGEMVERCLEPRRPFDIFNVGSGRGASTEEVLDLIEKAVGHPIRRQRLVDVDDAHRLVSWAVLDITKAEHELGWRPRIALEDGIRNLFLEYKAKIPVENP
ncbi:MAG TPA: NAD-dependent epimerase/dehydratase family protein [Stellaceae bacterium]|nr:NAD-dependent epimerase/dehydratase family protein [Stellaceae bacterium]